MDFAQIACSTHTSTGTDQHPSSPQQTSEVAGLRPLKYKQAYCVLCWFAGWVCSQHPEHALKIPVPFITIIRIKKKKILTGPQAPSTKFSCFFLSPFFCFSFFLSSTFSLFSLSLSFPLSVLMVYWWCWWCWWCFVLAAMFLFLVE